MDEYSRQARQQGIVHPLGLHPQEIQHVEVGEDPIEVVEMSTGQPSIDGGSSVGGATSMT